MNKFLSRAKIWINESAEWKIFGISIVFFLILLGGLFVIPRITLGFLFLLGVAILILAYKRSRQEKK